jgi:1,4-alpha-glucan branching enzyme
MAISKKFLKNQAVCKVQFRLSAEEVQGASEVFLVGDFNSWNHTSDPMKRRKDGAFSLEIKLPSGQDYRFRYRTDDNVWFNDPEADALVPCVHAAAENFLVKV